MRVDCREVTFPQTCPVGTHELLCIRTLADHRRARSLRPRPTSDSLHAIKGIAGTGSACMQLRLRKHSISCGIGGTASRFRAVSTANMDNMRIASPLAITSGRRDSSRFHLLLLEAPTDIRQHPHRRPNWPDGVA